MENTGVVCDVCGCAYNEGGCKCTLSQHQTQNREQSAPGFSLCQASPPESRPPRLKLLK